MNSQHNKKIQTILFIIIIFLGFSVYSKIRLHYKLEKEIDAIQYRVNENGWSYQNMKDYFNYKQEHPNESMPPIEYFKKLEKEYNKEK